MIRKEIVEKVISENCKIHAEKPHPQRERIVKTKVGDLFGEGENLLKPFEWTDRQKELRDYIMSLPIDDIIDLLALCEYGKLKCKKDIYNEDNIQLFNDIRKDYKLANPAKEDCRISILDMFKDGSYPIHSSLRAALSLYSK